MTSPRPTTIWRSREESAKERGLARPEGDYPEVIQRFILARQLEATADLFSPKMNDLKDPFALNGMTQATDRFVRAFRAQEKICIYADFDLDGTSGLALLLHGLKAIGYKNII